MDVTVRHGADGTKSNGQKGVEKSDFHMCEKRCLFSELRETEESSRHFPS